MPERQEQGPTPQDIARELLSDPNFLAGIAGAAQRIAGQTEQEKAIDAEVVAESTPVMPADQEAARQRLARYSENFNVRREDPNREEWIRAQTEAAQAVLGKFEGPIVGKSVRIKTGSADPSTGEDMLPANVQAVVLRDGQPVLQTDRYQSIWVETNRGQVQESAPIEVPLDRNRIELLQQDASSESPTQRTPEEPHQTRSETIEDDKTGEAPGRLARLRRRIGSIASRGAQSTSRTVRQSGSVVSKGTKLAARNTKAAGITSIQATASGAESAARATLRGIDTLDGPLNQARAALYEWAARINADDHESTQDPDTKVNRLRSVSRWLVNSVLLMDREEIARKQPDSVDKDRKTPNTSTEEEPRTQPKRTKRTRFSKPERAKRRRTRQRRARRRDTTRGILPKPRRGGAVV